MSPHRRQPLALSASPVKWACQWLLVTVLSFSALLVSLGAPFLFGHKIEAGETAEHDYVARQKSVVVDVAKTQDLQDEARQSLLPVLVPDVNANRAIEAQLRAKLNGIDASIKGTVAEDRLTRRLADTISPERYSSWRDDVERITAKFLETNDLVSGTDLSDWRHRVYEYLPENWGEPLRPLTATLIASTLSPNVRVDKENTKKKISDHLDTIKPVTKEIETGTLVVQRGEVLAAEDVSMLAQLGITETHDFGHLLAVGIALISAFFLFGIFLFTYNPEFFWSPSALALMATVCVVTSGIAAAIGHQYPQFVPLPATALALSVIFGRRVAMVLALLVILFLRVSNLVDAAHLIALSAASGIALGANITKRKELMLTGILIGIVQAVAFLAATLWGLSTSTIPLGKELLQNLLGGLSSSIVAIGSLPFLEIIFGILTPFRVAELSEPDQPLLRQLEENAPGTYQHSLAVANLAEAGAKAIFADINLVRAGAMYHDIGKMVTPRYFIENQLGDKNPHDEITPEESRNKVLDHVTNGLVLARKYGLPRQIQDFIPEHQGTTIMAYFYYKACLRDGEANVKDSDYRYPGPKPQNKETAIVMLADVSEAVTHSMRDPTQEEVELAIANVFKARWDDGQFTEAGINESEMEKVKNAFVRVWRTLHHERLKYPSTTTGRMPVPPKSAGDAIPVIAAIEDSNGSSSQSAATVDDTTPESSEPQPAVTEASDPLESKRHHDCC